MHLAQFILLHCYTLISDNYFLIQKKPKWNAFVVGREMLLKTNPPGWET